MYVWRENVETGHALSDLIKRLIQKSITHVVSYEKLSEGNYSGNKPDTIPTHSSGI